MSFPLSRPPPADRNGRRRRAERRAQKKKERKAAETHADARQRRLPTTGLPVLPPTHAPAPTYRTTGPPPGAPIPTPWWVGSRKRPMRQRQASVRISTTGPPVSRMPAPAPRHCRSRRCSRRLSTWAPAALALAAASSTHQAPAGTVVHVKCTRCPPPPTPPTKARPIQANGRSLPTSPNPAMSRCSGCARFRTSHVVTPSPPPQERDDPRVTLR